MQCQVNIRQNTTRTSWTKPHKYKSAMGAYRAVLSQYPDAVCFTDEGDDWAGECMPRGRILVWANASESVNDDGSLAIGSITLAT